MKNIYFFYSVLSIVVQTTQPSISATLNVITTRTRSTPTMKTKVLSTAQTTSTKNPVIPTTRKIKAIRTESANSTGNNIL